MRIDDVVRRNACHRRRNRILEEIKMLHKEIITRGDCVSLKQLAVNGKDIIELGVTPGKHLGEILEQLLQKVLDNPSLNQKESLLSLVKE